jgi:hypothetical protein
LGVPSFRTSLQRMKQSSNSVGLSVASPRQVSLTLHLPVGFSLQSLTQEWKIIMLDYWRLRFSKKITIR